jgi:protein-S-isoprenylcysteine O-methyltransferase Ste14
MADFLRFFLPIFFVIYFGVALAYVLIQIQIRLEEEFLTKDLGQKYLEYKQKVRRFI